MQINYNNLPDEELATHVDGSIVYFEILIKRYESRLLRYIFRISQFSQDEAEEILQEIFLKVWKNLRGFSADMKFSSWIYRIAHNETISQFRRVKSRGILDQVEMTDDLFIPSKINFVKDLDIQIRSENIQEILSAMDKNFREILVLKFLEEKNYEEISDILHLPLGTIATRISRAKKQFRYLLNRLGKTL